MNNFADFCDYFNNKNNQNHVFQDAQAYKTYYDAYSSYLVARKYNLEDVKTYRMNSLIDYFMELNKLNQNYREDLRKYYLTYIKDNFNTVLNAPRCPFYEAERLQREEEQQAQYEDDTDEVRQHYKDLEAKYKCIVDMVYKINHPDEEQYDDEYYAYSDRSSTTSDTIDFDEYDYYEDYEYDDNYDNYEQDDYISDDDYY